jgi:hypothetical protein
VSAAPVVAVPATPTPTPINQPPVVAIRLQPAPDATGTIVGVSPFQVVFDACATRDTDAGDDLRFTYDFDGNGEIDFRGFCRTTHEYRLADVRGCVRAKICVSDRQPFPGHEVCQVVNVCVQGNDDVVAPTPTPQPTAAPTDPPK